jgi:AcrR family transcriptional regulator
MMGVTVPYERTGRTRQKARTREALIAAARELLAQGVVPTIEKAAIAAAISRTTAYRYFSNVGDLLAAAYPHVEERSLLGPDPPQDPAERLAIVVENHTRRILENEAQMRAVLRLSLQGIRPPDLPMHRGLRIAWIEDALAPLRGQMADDELRRLIHGIGATLGIEAFVWLTDVAGLSREEAAATIRSNALGLVRGATADHNRTARSPARSGSETRTT